LAIKKPPKNCAEKRRTVRGKGCRGRQRAVRQTLIVESAFLDAESYTIKHSRQRRFSFKEFQCRRAGLTFQISSIVRETANERSEMAHAARLKTLHSAMSFR
jgi:hypothetical protein